MKWQEFVKDYLSFTRRERIGMLVILALMLLVILLPGIISKKTGSAQMPVDTAWMSAIKRLEINKPDGDPGEKNNDEDNSYAYQYDRAKNSSAFQSKAELFYFDPNTISGNDWKKLGLREKTIGTIQNYLNKGGHFYKPDDLQKIYGLHKNEYERLVPYIRIESASATKNDEKNVSAPTQNENRAVKKFTTRYSAIDINIADTTAFISLPGIGSRLAARIINFRDKLGGFYSIEQVGETYGLPDSTYQKIKQYLKLENASIKKININTATVDELKVHPYIKYSIANPIIAYRNEHGLFSKVEDLKKVMVVTEEIYKKIVPYLTTN